MSWRRPWLLSQANAGATDIPTSSKIPVIARLIFPPTHSRGSAKANTSTGRKLRARFACGYRGKRTTHCSGNRIEWLVRPFHFVFHAASELLDFIRFLNNVKGENVFVGLVDISFELDGEFQKFVRVTLECGDAFFRSLLFHIVLDAGARFVAVGHGRVSVSRDRGARRILRQAGGQKNGKKEREQIDPGIHGHLVSAPESRNPTQQNYTSRKRKSAAADGDRSTADRVAVETTEQDREPRRSSGVRKKKRKPGSRPASFQHFGAVTERSCWPGTRCSTSFCSVCRSEAPWPRPVTAG